MNKTLIRRSDYPFMLIAFCFFVGIGSGTVWINRMGAELQEQLGAYGFVWFGSAGVMKPQADQLFHVLLQRELAGGLLWLVGMTAFALPGMCVTALLGGFSGSAILSLMTVQAGLFGLPAYLLSLLPHALFYLPAVTVLLFWGVEAEKKTHLAGFLILALLIAAGALAECCLNPYCMRLLNLFH